MSKGDLKEDRMFTLWRMAYRNLSRNRRRTVLTLLVVTLGVALLVTLAGFVEGEIDSVLSNGIRLETGHIQLREESYEAEKLSLAWEDLLEDPATLATQAETLDEVRVATPVLWSSGILSAGEDSVSLRIYGIDPQSEAFVPFREGLVDGQFLAPDDREGILISRRLARNLGLAVGSDVSLLTSTANQRPDEAIFTVRGVFDSGVPVYDETTVLLPLAKAQTFTRTEGHASAVWMLLEDREQADLVAQKLDAPQFRIVTWEDLNTALLSSLDEAMGIMYLMYLVMLAVVAVIVANTLLMSVFERTQEMGILAALGMKSRQLLSLFLLEAGTLGLIGVLVGVLLGSLGVLYLATVGVDIGELSTAVAYSDLTIPSKIYAKFALDQTITLSLMCLVITLAASLYPAWLGARMEPVEALRAL
jgi:ABC-type lipoprotein release transport system permease subunit